MYSPIFSFKQLKAKCKKTEAKLNKRANFSGNIRIIGKELKAKRKRVKDMQNNTKNCPSLLVLLVADWIIVNPTAKSLIFDKDSKFQDLFKACSELFSLNKAVL
jgi:hypothetical protein